MKKTKRILSIVLALALVLSACFALVACQPTETPEEKYNCETSGHKYVKGVCSECGARDGAYHAEMSEVLYDYVLGDFASAYEAAKKATSVSERYALMAIAEAKLLQSGVMLPTTGQGGNYAISRSAPYSVPNVLWGNDSYRYHSAIVASEPIKSADREALKSYYASHKGDGTYEAYAVEYLTGKGYTIKDTYTQSYSSDPKTWDVLATSRAADSEAIVNTYDGLLEYDFDGNLQPALAESYTVSEDGLKYTFQIRSGAKWVNSQGSEVAEVTADDFVAGFQHMLDAAGGLEYLVQGVVVNADEYINGEVTDFSQVGVKALEGNKVEYTLCAPTSYFTTMLGYGVFAPMSRSYYESKGGKFGGDFDPAATDYTYGKTVNDIAYCGPFVVSNHTAENTIVFSQNASYWNKDNIKIKTFTWLYNDGKVATKAYEDMVAGTIDGAGLNASALELAKKADAKYPFAEYSYITGVDATAFMNFLNINRSTYANVADNTKAISPKTAEQKEVANIAMLNRNFRMALSTSLDRVKWNGVQVGEELAATSLINSYTPGTFVSLSEAVTVEINGVDRTFAAGTFYGAIIQAQLDADHAGIKVWDPTLEGGQGASYGFDGWYNVENAKSYLAKAINDIKATHGITISKDNPVYIDLPVYSGSATYQARGEAYKQSIEEALGGVVKVNLIACENSQDWYDAGYYTDFGYEANYDCYDVSGWGPDFGDPCSYLDTFLGGGAGYMIKCIGLF